MAQNVAKIGTTEYATLQDAVDAVKEDGYAIIKIINTAEFDGLNIADKRITIDLQKNTVKGNYINVTVSKGKSTYLKIQDTSKNKALSVDENNNYSVTYKNSGILELTRSIKATNGAGIKVVSGTIVSTENVALFALGDFAGKDPINSYIEITGGYIKAESCCVSPQGLGATVTIDGKPVLESLNNAVVSGNGTYKDDKKLGGTSITIMGKSWLIGRIKNNDEAACGIYHPQQGTLTIKYHAGIPNIVAINGAGIVMRGGTLEYKAGNITAIGDANFTGTVGDSRVVVGTSGIVYDRDCGYYDVANAKITITSTGEKKVVGAKSAIQVINDSNNNIDGVFDITAGNFSSDVSAYVAKDSEYECNKHGEASYIVNNFSVKNGDVKYVDLRDAFSEAKDGDVITILKDREYNSYAPKVEGKSITLDLNGKNSSYMYLEVKAGGNLTIKDSGTGGTFNGTGANSAIYVNNGGVFNQESGTLTNSSTNSKTSNVVVRVEGGTATTRVASTANIKGGKIESKGTPVFVAYPGATVNVSGGELVGNGLACIAGNGTEGQGGTTINVSGGTLTAAAADEASAACGIYHPNEGTLNITGGTINVTGGVGVLMRGGKMTMTGGEINATGDATRTGSVGDTNQKIGVSGVIFDRDANYPAVATTSISIDGEAKVNGAKEAVELINTNNVADAKSAFKLKGGTYNKDVSALLDENTVAEEKNGVYVVTTYYAQVGETKYATLQAAADAATAGQTVTVLNDVDMTTGSNLTVKAGQDIVLDMNGHSIKGANTNDYTQNINVYGKLTLMDSKENSTGKIYVETPYQRGVYDRPLVYVAGNGEFVMNSGYIYTVIPDDPVNKGQYGIAAYDQGKITINGGTIEAGFCAITSRDDANSNTNITIDGGTLISPMDYAIAHRTAGKLTVIKGVIYGGSGAISMKRGELEIKGGTLTSKGTGDTGNWGDGTGNLGNAALNFCKPYGNVTATITGGTITAEGDAVLIDAQPTEGKNVDISISGGTYSSDVSKYCAAGFTATPKADGTYGISKVGDLSVMVAYDKAYDNVAAGGEVNINMDTVNKIMVAKNEVANVTTTLTKTFSNTGWNAFFVPFDFKLTAEMLNNFEFAKLFNASLENGNGSTIIAYHEAKAGETITAYLPCLIKAKATGEQKLAVGEVTYKNRITTKDCSSITELYTFYPVMENTYIAAEKGYYLNSAQNSFVYNVNEKAYVQPLRYYMTIQNRSDGSYIVPANGGASKAKFCVIGEGEATGITDIVDDAANASGKVYNLQGVLVGNTTEGLPKGVYIKNGRKIIVK